MQTITIRIGLIFPLRVEMAIVSAEKTISALKPAAVQLQMLQHQASWPFTKQTASLLASLGRSNQVDSALCRMKHCVNYNINRRGKDRYKMQQLRQLKAVHRPVKNIIIHGKGVAVITYKCESECFCQPVMRPIMSATPIREELQKKQHRTNEDQTIGHWAIVSKVS